jgi:MFS family permease
MKTFLRSILDQYRSLSKPGRLFLAAVFMDGLLFSGFYLFLNLYIVEAGYSRDFLGMVNAAPSIAALVLGVPMGLLSDRIGRKRAMIIGFTLANLAILGMVLVKTQALIFVLALAWGATGQLYMLSHAPFMMKVSNDKNRDVLFSFSFGMFPLASTLGSFLAGYLPGIFRTWFGVTSGAGAYQGVLLVSVIASFLVLVPLFLLREPKADPAQVQPVDKAGKVSIGRVFLRPLTWKLSLPNLAIGFGAAMLVPYFNVFFAEEYRMSDASLGILFSMASLVTGVACLLGPRLVGNLGGKIRTVVLGQAASIGFLLMIGFSPWAWLAVIGFLARGALMNMTAPLFDAFALEQTPASEHGAVNSIRNLAWNVGWAVGPYLSGLVQQRWGFTPLFINTMVLYAVAILLTWVFFRPRPAAILEGVSALEP